MLPPLTKPPTSHLLPHLPPPTTPPTSHHTHLLLLLEAHHVFLRLLRLRGLRHRHREVVEAGLQVVIKAVSCFYFMKVPRFFFFYFICICTWPPPMPMPIPLSMGGNMSASVPPESACRPRQAITWARWWRWRS